MQARERELLAEARQQLSAAEARLEAERSSQATQQQQFSYREQVSGLAVAMLLRVCLVLMSAWCQPARQSQLHPPGAWSHEKAWDLAFMLPGWHVLDCWPMQLCRTRQMVRMMAMTQASYAGRHAELLLNTSR